MDVYSFMYNCILYIGSVIFLRDLITYSLSPVSLLKPEDQAMLGIGPHVNIMSGSCALRSQEYRERLHYFLCKCFDEQLKGADTVWAILHDIDM